MSKSLSTLESAKSKEKTFYIFFVFSKANETDISFNFPSKKTDYSLRCKQTIPGGFRYSFILKHIHQPKDAAEIVFDNKGEIFKVCFNADEGNFIFNPELKIKKNKTSPERAISQKNVIKAKEIFVFFEKYLEEKKEGEKLKILYNDCVDFFNSNPDFEFLIYLFTKVSGIDLNFKDICVNLLKSFWENTVPEKIDKLNKQSETCKEYLEKMKSIASKSEKLISENGFDKAKFYGLLLFYFNTYDNKYFDSLIKKLQEQKENENALFDILINFSSTLLNDINISMEQYINYLLVKDFKTLEQSGFSYFKKVEEFIHILYTKKETIIKMSGFKTLHFPEFKEYKLESHENFIKELKGIIVFLEDKKKIFIFLPGTFWKAVIDVLTHPSSNNIDFIFHMRENFKYYLKLIKDNYKKDKAFYLDADNMDQKDELGKSLHKMIVKYINTEKEISNDEIIKLISEFDAYYNEDNYIDRREVNFLDKINFDEKETEWIAQFKSAQFENTFANIIEKYIQKLISKISKIEDLGKVISLINEDIIKNLNEMDYLIRELKKKTFYLMKNWSLINDEKASKEKLAAFAKLFIFFYKNTQKLEKIKDLLDKLDFKNKHLIFLELLKYFVDDIQMREYIFNYYTNNMNIYYKNIIELLNILNEDNIKNFMERISNKKEPKNYRIITYENFFTEKESLNLNLLYELTSIIDKMEQYKIFYWGESKNVLENICKKLNKKLEIKYLKILLSFPEDNIKKRFELLNKINKNIDPEEKYINLKNSYIKAYKEIKELNNILKALKVFHKNFHSEEIKKIEEAIGKFNDGEISDFYNIDLLLIELGEDLKKKVEEINKIKDSSTFKKIFDNAPGSNDQQRWEYAVQRLKPEFMALRRQNKKVDDKFKKEFQIIIDFLGLNNDEQTKKDWKYLEDSSGAEEDIRNMLFFCENFKINENENKNEKPNYQKSGVEVILSKVYENIKNNTNKEDSLEILKKENIYDCSKKGINIQFFNLFNNQKEAIDFLLNKTPENLEIIKDKLINIDNTVKANDIDDVGNCMDFFKNNLGNCKNDYELFEVIKKIDENLMNKFKKFINIFPSLVELDNNSDNSYNLYIQANKYFKEATYYISLNYEEKYTYIDKDGEQSIKLDEIKSIKHKINIPNEVKLRIEDEKDIHEEQEKISLEKTKLLLKFKEIVSNIELIEQFISVFQTKGCSLPIEIQIIIKYPEITYILRKKKIQDFSVLSQYLLNVNNYLDDALDWYYKSEQNLRFLYGKQFDTFNKHITGSKEIPSFLRYILNNLNDDMIIKEGKKSFPSSTKNYVDRYKDYSNDWFKTYNDYISSVLQANGTNIEELYETMKIKSDNGEVYKGIYLYKSDYNSMEEDILKIFIEKTKNIPIAQNILISNKETSFEEIQSFFHRAFLCRFNTLFAIEVNDSLSDSQLKIMNSFINKLLKFQLERYNKLVNKKIDIKETSKYIEPLIIFVYNVNKLKESFLNEINKYEPKIYPKIDDDDININGVGIKSFKKLKSDEIESKLYQILQRNTHIYSSEVCGLGKTEKIKYLIKEKNKEYIYFPLGGKLSRDIIFKKVGKKLKKVKDIQKAAIHLDLFETEDTSILNEFLFSFCFTKFYMNNENVLYIPVGLEIYIEIPNSFNNFLDDYPILNYYEIKRIDFQTKDKLRLDKETSKFFNWMIPEEDIEGRKIKKTPEEYILENIGTNRYSYHQINIFIKLFLNQYKADNKKLSFSDHGKDVTNQCIENFAKCTQYFTLGIYARFLTGTLEEEEENNNNNKDKNVSNENINHIETPRTTYSNIKFDNENETIEIIDTIQSEKNNSNNSKTDDKIEKESKGIKEIINVNYEELRKNYIFQLTKLYKRDIKKEYKIPLIFNYKNKDYFRELFLSDSKYETFTDEDFLYEIKRFLELENPINKEENSELISLKEIIEKDNYVITKDNFKKMMLILYRISANIPIILMGETGCGKTGLIRKLYQLINNGEEMDPDKNILKVDSSINEENLVEKMDKINNEARKFKEGKKDKELWVLFDEINTCNSLGLINEIFINRSYNGIKIEENIRLIGTCNPYRLKTEKEEMSGLIHPFKNKNLAYDVNILPQSLMYYVFNFGSLTSIDEDKYIFSILSNGFKDYNFEKGLINIVKEIISKCHSYLRELYGDSIVSLREIKRFIKLFQNLYIYYKNKDELIEENKLKKENEKKEIYIKKKTINKIKVPIVKKINIIKSLILTTYLSYYIRLIDSEIRTNFESVIKPSLIKLANYYHEKDKNKKNNGSNKNDELSKNNEIKNEEENNISNPLGIIWKPLVKDYKNCNSENTQNYSLFFENECDFVISQINLDKGIAKNRILKENIFLQFIAITSNIPMIIIGKPGSSKSLSYLQLKNSMRGKYSKSPFFSKYPQLITSYFQGSDSTLPEDIENLFQKGRDILTKYKNQENKPISLLIFDEIGLSEFAKDNPVKVLHKNLEYEGFEEGLSFVGFSNWKLDSSKLNRVLYLSVPNLDKNIDDLIDTAQCIAENIKENNVDPKFLEVLCNSYKTYKEMVTKIKEYVVYKELEIQEMKQVLDSLTQDEIKNIFKKDKKEITLQDFIEERINIKTNKYYSWKRGNFTNVKNEISEYKDLYSKNRSVNEDFHGNRDFYNYIKGIFNIKSLSKNLENNSVDLSTQIEKVIERNFGGVEINLDIDFNIDKIYENESKIMKKINDIITIYPKAKKKLKLPSVLLFKYIYNESFEDKENNKGNEINNTDDLNYENYKIKKENLTKYDLIQCINGNINDNDARYMLLEIEEGLEYLIYQNIVSQNKDKVIKYMEGSPFINDIKDKNGEYKMTKISEIQDYLNKDMLLIISNLNQIYPFLYDIFNRNFITKDDKKYGRICQGNVSEQTTYIHDKFRIIVMINKNSIQKQESPFLNRFEKAIVKFEDLLTHEQKNASRDIFGQLEIKQLVDNLYYNIKNFLINYDKSSIDRLYFYYSNKNLREEEIKQKIYEKIARTLPQDIIINLENNTPNKNIKSLYNKRKIFNYIDYLNYLKQLNENRKNFFKFSIIYTFTDIISEINGLNENKNDSKNMISEIKKEKQMIEIIEKNYKSIKAYNNIFVLHFYQNEMDKIGFIISLLKNNFTEINIKFIFIVHIKRVMDKKRKEKIYSIPDIDETVDQIFIDNLNGLEISLQDLANKGIKNILNNSKLVNKNEEFFKALKAYYNIYTDKINFIGNYFPNVKKYFEKNPEFIEIIISKSFDLIYEKSKYNDKDGSKENLETFDKIKKELFDKSYITYNTIDIISLIINNVIIEKRFKSEIINVIDMLESNNFITTLLTLDSNNDLSSNKSLISKINLGKILEQYLENSKFSGLQGKACFNTKYLVPGFLSFYNIISEYITKNISQKFFKNEKELRDFLGEYAIKKTNNFHKEEARLLQIVSKEIIDDESDNYKFVNEVIKSIPIDLLLEDYINLFLSKNNECSIFTFEDITDIDSNISSFDNDEENKKEEVDLDDFYVKIIRQIINLKYQDDSKIIVENEDNELNKFLIKIIWLESNKDYVFTILELFGEVQNKIYKNNKRNLLLEQINYLINNNKIKYITKEDRNPEHTKEVNECYYIILGALYLAITDLEKIILFDPNNNRDFVSVKQDQIKVAIETYLSCLKKIIKISEPFNDTMYIFSNELYIIINLNSIISLLKSQDNDYIDIQIVENIIKILREGIDIIRENKFVKIGELKNNVDDLINIISENIKNQDNQYYSLIRNIIIQEIKKVKDKIYRLDLFKSYVINEKEILINSNEIFDLLLKGLIIPSKTKFLETIKKLENKGDEILLVIEKIIRGNNCGYLSQILLYYFENISHSYFENYFKIKKKEDEKNLLFEKEPLDAFNICYGLLSQYSSCKSKIKNVCKIFYIGYIRAFLYKLEEYKREKSKRLINYEAIISSINSLKNPISFMIELYYYKIIYNKNNRDLNIFFSEENLYNLESLNNFKDIYKKIINKDNYNEENDDKEDKEDKEISLKDLLDDNIKYLKSFEEKYPFKEYFYYSDYIDEKYLASIIKDKNKDYPVLSQYLELKNDGNILNDFYIYNKALNSLNDEFSNEISRKTALNETLDKQIIYKENKNKDLFDEFIKIYNKIISSNEDDEDGENNYDENDNENKIEEVKKLNAKLPLLNFLIVDINEFSEKYKYIYSQFINKHNEIFETLKNSNSKYINIQNKNKINVQNITKENEIFTTKKNIQNLLFNCSYRKVIINENYSEFNKYEINLEYIEELLADEFSKNKKLINDDIFEFKFKDEDLEFKNKDICTKFKQKIKEEELNIDDKIIMYEYFEGNKGNINLHLKLLDDFAYLINYSYQNIDKIKDPSTTLISQLNKELEIVSNEFKEFFEIKNVPTANQNNFEINKKNFTVSKLLNIYEYYQILCFNKIKENLRKYQVDITDEKQNNSIKSYIKNDLKANEKIKNYLELALRRFILCFIVKENDKENKVKLNENSINNYLEIEDLWNKDFYKKKEFYQEIKKLKNLGIKINNVIKFYDKCFGANYKNNFDDVNEELNRREEERIKKEKEEEKNDLSNFNPNNLDIDEIPNEKEEPNKNENNTKNDNLNNLNEKDENKNANENKEEDDNEDDYLPQGNNDEDEDLGRW